MYCRGHATRIKIIETYKLVPLGRFKLLQWDFNLILYWCTGFISIIFLYFKQLKEKWENYIFEKKIECTDTNNKHE